MKLRLLALAAVSSLLLGACGSDSDDSDTAADGGWSYTSGDGETYSADVVPERIIAQGEAAAALISYGIRPVGIYLSQPLEESKALEGVDLEGIEIIGETWGEIDAEKAAELQPDLIVAAYWPVEEAYGGFEEGVEEEAKKVATLADVVGPTAGESTVTMLEGFEELAATLGADTEAGDGADAKQTFEEARDRFQDVVAEKEDLNVLAVSPADDLLYVAVPEHSAELVDFSSWGLDVTVPDSPEPGFEYWENLSWEKADKYQSDLILLDDRSYDTSLATAQKQPTWTKIKAAEAGAITPWPAYWISTYAAYAEQLDQLSDAIEKADPGLA